MKFKIQLLIIISLINFVVFGQNKTWTCIDVNGKTQFTIEAKIVYDFHNGLARIYKNTLVNNKWVSGYGYVDRAGKIVIPCDNYKATDFHGAVAWVQKEKNGSHILIDKSGRVVQTKEYDKVKRFTAKQKF